jgi:metal-sulfur cluster biosynthetic enzyme
MATKDMVLEALRGVMDPELGLSVVDLGMIREVLISGEQVEVKMVLTAPFCPLADAITEDARQAIEALPGVREAKVTLLDEPWDPAWIKRGA